MLTATGLVRGKTANFNHWPPAIQNRHTSTDRQLFVAQLISVITSARRTPKPNLMEVRHGGDFCGIGWNITQILKIYLYLIFSGTPLGLQIRPVDGCLCLMDQTTRTRARVCFGGLADISSNLWAKSPKKSILGAYKRHFPAKPTKIKFAIISKRQIESPRNLVTKYRLPNSLCGWSRIRSSWSEDPLPWHLIMSRTDDHIYSKD